MMTSFLSLPLFWATLTIAGYVIGQQLYQHSNGNPFLQPVLVGLAIVLVVVELSNTTFETYMTGGTYLHQMLAPVVVMLAVPMVDFLHSMRKQWLRIILAVSLGSGVTIAIAGGLTYWLLGDKIVTATMLTKSVTTPIAVAIAEEVDAIPALASAFVMITGLLGALMVPTILKVARIQEPAAQGMALGVCAHAVGTAQALTMGRQQAAYSAMAMTLTGTLHAIILPLLLTL